MGTLPTITYTTPDGSTILIGLSPTRRSVWLQWTPIGRPAVTIPIPANLAEGIGNGIDWMGALIADSALGEPELPATALGG